MSSGSISRDDYNQQRQALGQQIDDLNTQFRAGVVLSDGGKVTIEPIQHNDGNIPEIHSMLYQIPNLTNNDRVSATIRGEEERLLGFSMYGNNPLPSTLKDKAREIVLEDQRLDEIAAQNHWN